MNTQNNIRSTTGLPNHTLIDTETSTNSVGFYFLLDMASLKGLHSSSRQEPPKVISLVSIVHHIVPST